MPTDDDARRAALALLKAGLATLSEVAELVPTSRQLVRYWADRAGIDSREARAELLKAQWAKKLARAKRHSITARRA